MMLPPLDVVPHPNGEVPSPAGHGLALLVQSMIAVVLTEVSAMLVGADENANIRPLISDWIDSVGLTVSVSVIESELPSSEKTKTADPCWA
jgi:hypothetical protein